MRALVYHRPGRRAWEDVPQPGLVEDTGAREAVVTPRGS